MSLSSRVGTAEHEIYESFSRGEIVLTRCETCGFCRFYPYSFCHACGDASLSNLISSGQGVIHTVTINYRRDSADVIIVVELEYGTFILSRLVDAVDGDPLRLIGSAVELCQESDDAFTFPVFTLVRSPKKGEEE